MTLTYIDLVEALLDVVHGLLSTPVVHHDGAVGSPVVYTSKWSSGTTPPVWCPTAKKRHAENPL